MSWKYNRGYVKKEHTLWMYCYYKLIPEFRFWEKWFLSHSRSFHNWWQGIWCIFFLFACQSQQEWGDKGGTQRYHCNSAILNKPDNKIICCYWKTLPMQSGHLFCPKGLVVVSQYITVLRYFFSVLLWKASSGILPFKYMLKFLVTSPV